MCQVLRVGRSGYYAWKSRSLSLRDQENTLLLEKIRQIHKISRETYGSPRITRVLRDEGNPVGHNRVARLMRQNGLQAKARRSYKRTTDSKHGLRVSPNRVQQNFQVSHPNQLWVSDITYIRTQEGWLYLAAILDACTREIVGWSMLPRLHDELVLGALRQAFGRKQPEPGLVFHSDRGSQYASERVRAYLQDQGCVQSMSGKGNCYDNALIESFFHTLKTEHVRECRFTSRRQAMLSIFEYIEVYYNRNRMHSGIGYQAPGEYVKYLQNKLN